MSGCSRSISITLRHNDQAKYVDVLKQHGKLSWLHYTGRSMSILLLKSVGLFTRECTHTQSSVPDSSNTNTRANSSLKTAVITIPKTSEGFLRKLRRTLSLHFLNVFLVTHTHTDIHCQLHSHLITCVFSNMYKVNK